MASYKSFVLFFFFFVHFVVVNSARCTPGMVLDITITSDKSLTWSKALNPFNCSISGYVIDIFDPEDGSQLQLQTSLDLNYTLSFLEMCKTYSIEVHAITDQNVLGPADRISATIPAAAKLNLALKVNNATLSNGDEIHLSWNPIATDVSRCISYYRVVYWDENNSPIDTYVSTNNFTLRDNIVACMEYTFQVSAVVTNPDTEGPLAEINWPGYIAVTKPPKLEYIVGDETTVNMTWIVPAYSENRCQLIALVIDILGLPANASTTVISIEDSPLRPNVDVYLEGLTSNTIYTSRVSLENTAGYSKNVTLTFQTSDSFAFNYETDLTYY